MKKFIMLLLFACFAMVTYPTPQVHPPGDQSIDNCITVECPATAHVGQITIAEVPEVTIVYSMMDNNLQIIHTDIILVEAPVAYINIVSIINPHAYNRIEQWKIDNFSQQKLRGRYTFTADT